MVCGIAVANHPQGPFEKYGKPIMVNPEEDCFQGFFTKAGKCQVALFTSRDGFDWQPDETPLAFVRELPWEDGTVQPLMRMERPHLHIVEGKPKVLLRACIAEGSDRIENSFTVQIPLK